MNAPVDPQFYSASLAAWFNTSLERDKAVLALSGGGIGLLVTLLVNHGADSPFALFSYVFGILAFALSLVSVVFIFTRNRDHLQQVLNGNAGLDPLLSAADRVAVVSFATGAVLTAMVGISPAASKYTEKTMKNEPIHTSTPITEKKSFNGVGNLIPSAPAATPTQAPASQPAQQPATPTPK